MTTHETVILSLINVAIDLGLLWGGYAMGVFAERRAVRRRLAHHTTHELLMALRDRVREQVKNSRY